MVSELHHFYLEMFAVVFGAVIAFYCTSRAFTLNDRFSLFIGMGFLASALIDVLNAVVSISSAGETSFLGYFIPQMWVASRIINAGMIVLALIRYADLIVLAGIRYADLRQTIITRNTLITIPGTIVSISIGIILLSLFAPFPHIVIDFPIHRPYEVLAIALFFTALIFFCQRRLSHMNDVFYKGILTYLIISIIGEATISYSTTNFDTPFNVAQILKDASYFVIVIALAVSSIRYAEELKRKDRLKDEFISVASHELRSPIQPILGFATLAKKGKIEQEAAWEGVLQHSRRLQNLASSILDVSRIQSGELRYVMEKVRINEVILEVVNSAKVNLSKDVSLETNLDKNVEIDADRLRITQVLANIIGNSVKFTDKGHIRVESNVSSARNEIEIKISDTGGGIPNDVLPNLFSKFVTKGVRDKAQLGTGLGLFISKEIVLAHNGEISAYNNNEGGATFTIVLPISRDQKMN